MDRSQTVPRREPVPRSGEHTLERTRIVIGLLGGIGAGKSFVAARISALSGATVLDADAAAHEALDQCAADGRLAEALGDEFVTAEGKADRAALGARVFRDPALLRRLERMVHPMVLALIQDVVQNHRRGEGPAVLVLDVPLLIEVGLDRSCDALWFVDASEELRKERAGSRGLSWEETKLREQSQSPIARKRKRADTVIHNDVAPDELDEQIRQALDAMGIRAPTTT